MTITEAAHALLAARDALDAFAEPSPDKGRTAALHRALELRRRALFDFHMAINDYSDVDFELMVARMLTAGVVTEAQVKDLVNNHEDTTP